MLASVRDNTAALGYVLDGVTAPSAELHTGMRPLEQRQQTMQYYQPMQHDNHQQPSQQRRGYAEMQSQQQHHDLARQRNGQHYPYQPQQQQQHQQQYPANRGPMVQEAAQTGYGSRKVTNRPSAIGQAQYTYLGEHPGNLHLHTKPPSPTGGIVPDLNLQPSPDNTYPPSQQVVTTPPLSAMTPAGTPAQLAQSSAGWFGSNYSLQSRPSQGGLFEQFSQRPRHGFLRSDTSASGPQPYGSASHSQYQRIEQHSHDQEQLQEQEQPLHSRQMSHPNNQQPQQQQAFVTNQHLNSFPDHVAKSIEQGSLPQNLPSSAKEVQSSVQFLPQDVPFEIGASKERNLEQLNMLTGQVQPGAAMATTTAPPFVSNGTGGFPSALSSLAQGGPPLSDNSKSGKPSLLKRPRAMASQAATEPDLKRTRSAPVNAGKVREILQGKRTEDAFRNQPEASEGFNGHSGQYSQSNRPSEYMQPGTAHAIQGDVSSAVPSRVAAGESNVGVARNDGVNSTLIARLRNFKPGQGSAGLTSALSAQAALGMSQSGTVSVPLASSIAMRAQPDLLPLTAGNGKHGVWSVPNAERFQRTPLYPQQQLGFGVAADGAGPSEHQNFGYSPGMYTHQRPPEDFAADPQFAESSGAQAARPYRCKFCPSSFGRRDNMQKHMRIIHMGERPFVCEVCGYAFQKKDHKEKHVRTVHYKERPHCCTRCDSRFGQKSDLSKHIRTVHDRVKPFACEHCGLSFGHRGNKARHVLVVHEKRKPFICRICSIGFGERSNLAKHIMAVHKQAPDLAQSSTFASE
jgi:hypothetical protein